MSQTGPRWDLIRRKPDLPFIAGGTDIVVGAPVSVVKGVWTVMPAPSMTTEPIGIAGASAAKEQAIPVRDRGEIARVLACASITGGGHVGAATVNLVTGASGNVQEVQYGEVKGATNTPIFAVGQALENAGPGQVFSFYVNPVELSGLT